MSRELLLPYSDTKHGVPALLYLRALPSHNAPFIRAVPCHVTVEIGPFLVQPHVVVMSRPTQPCFERHECFMQFLMQAAPADPGRAAQPGDPPLLEEQPQHVRGPDHWDTGPGRATSIWALANVVSRNGAWLSC